MYSPYGLPRMTGCVPREQRVLSWRELHLELAAPVVSRPGRLV